MADAAPGASGTAAGAVAPHGTDAFDGLGRARVAVAAAFALNGALFGVWASRVPAVKASFGLGEGALGLLLLCLAGGAIASFPVAGVLSDRVGAGPLVRRIAVGYVALFALLGAVVAAGDVWLLAAALAALGAAFGSMDVAMNGRAAEVERAAGRPIMSGFHALFSLGAGVGAASGFLASRLGASTPVHFWVAAAVLGATCGALMARGRHADALGHEATDEAGGPLLSLPRGPLLLVGLIGLGVALGEGALADWSAVYLVAVAAAPPAEAALGFAAFSVGMVALRLAGDRIVARFGPTATVRGSAVVALAGVALAVGVPDVAWVIGGFGLMGAGYAIVMPLVFSRAAADPDTPSGVAIAGVATLAYGGMLLGPPVIGGVAELVGLRGAFAMLAALALLSFALARHVTVPASRR